MKLYEVATLWLTINVVWVSCAPVWNINYDGLDDESINQLHELVGEELFESKGGRNAERQTLAPDVKPQKQQQYVEAPLEKTLHISISGPRKDGKSKPFDPLGYQVAICIELIIILWLVAATAYTCSKIEYCYCWCKEFTKLFHDEEFAIDDKDDKDKPLQDDKDMTTENDKGRTMQCDKEETAQTPNVYGKGVVDKVDGSPKLEAKNSRNSWNFSDISDDPVFTSKNRTTTQYAEDRSCNISMNPVEQNFNSGNVIVLAPRCDEFENKEVLPADEK